MNVLMRVKRLKLILYIFFCFFMISFMGVLIKGRLIDLLATCFISINTRMYESFITRARDFWDVSMGKQIIKIMKILFFNTKSC